MDPFVVAEVQTELLIAAQRCIAAHSPSWWSALFTSSRAHLACREWLPHDMRMADQPTPDDAAMFLLFVREALNETLES